MATKKKRSVLIAVLTLMLCLALAAGGSYALFSDEVVLTSHLEAGTMDISLWRVQLDVYELDDTTGFLEQRTPDTTPLNFSQPRNENVFGFDENTLIVPGSEYVATMEIRNEEETSDVAFKYWMEVVLKTEEGVEIAELANQVKVFVVTKADTEDKTEYEAVLSKGKLCVGSDTAPVGILAKNTTETFTVRVLFCNLDNETNNKAMGNEISFDLLVYAVQETKNPNSPATP